MTPQLGTIDRSDDRPPYRQIADMLRTAITTGQLIPGDKLPSEAELIGHFRVARMTARQAIQELRSEGLVMAEHGRGVFVRLTQPPTADQELTAHHEALPPSAADQLLRALETATALRRQADQLTDTLMSLAARSDVSVRDIAKAIGASSPATVSHHLGRITQGQPRRAPKGAGRPPVDVSTLKVQKALQELLSAGYGTVLDRAGAAIVIGTTGNPIGWTEGERAWLKPTDTHRALRSWWTDRHGTPLPFTKRGLGALLADSGIIRTTRTPTGARRNMIQTRVAGQPTWVWELSAEWLFADRDSRGEEIQYPVAETQDANT